VTPEQILEYPARVLSEAQRRAYFETGFLTARGLIPDQWLRRVVELSNAFLEESRSVTASNEAFDLGPEHGPARPHVRRLRALVDRHPDFWRFASESVLADIAADLVGPDVKFHSSKLNYKWPGSGEIVKWHQDIPAWPHTDYSPVTIGVYIDGCDEEQGPLAFLRGSHEGPLHSQYDDAGNFVVRIRDEVLGPVTPDRIARATGGPGTTVLLNCRTIHGSDANRSSRPRPLLLPVYSSADSFAYTASPIPSPHLGDIVRGKPARFASFDTRPCELPPDFRAGYHPPWLAQKDEEQRRTGTY
jgi:ectoine hydroxylase